MSGSFTGNYIQRYHFMKFLLPLIPQDVRAKYVNLSMHIEPITNMSFFTNSFA